MVSMKGETNMNDNVRHATRINCPFHILLIPSLGDAMRLPNALQNVDLAKGLGVTRAQDLFADCDSIEIVIIETMKNEAVANVLLRRRNNLWLVE